MPAPRKDAGGSLLRWRCGCLAMRSSAEMMTIEPCEEHAKLLSLVTPREDESSAGVMHSYRKDAFAKTAVAGIFDSKIARKRGNDL
jgi:hypothetical protein